MPFTQRLPLRNPIAASAFIPPQKILDRDAPSRTADIEAVNPTAVSAFHCRVSDVVINGNRRGIEIFDDLPIQIEAPTTPTPECVWYIALALSRAFKVASLGNARFHRRKLRGVGLIPLIRRRRQ